MVDGNKLLPRKKTENSKETNSHTSRQLYRSVCKKKSWRQTLCRRTDMQEDKETDRQRQMKQLYRRHEDLDADKVQADIRIG